jgi:hypothetical protein
MSKYVTKKIDEYIYLLKLNIIINLSYQAR